MEKKQSGSINALKVMMSIISISLIGISKMVPKSSHYSVVLSKMEKVAGALPTGHTGLLMSLPTLPNLSQPLLLITILMKQRMLSPEKCLAGLTIDKNESIDYFK